MWEPPPVRRLLAAPDKFRGTASAAEVAAAAGRGARHQGWVADEVPMSDGGEGLLEALGGVVRHTRVPGPLGEPVDAEWRWLDGPPSGRRLGDGPHAAPHGWHAGGGAPRWPTAVIEMARAAGRSLLPAPRGDDPLRASTRGVGELVVAAVAAGARRVVVGCGGSATTDGGLGAVEAIGEAECSLAGVDLVAAVDVRTRFADAARVFGPQKGATPAQVRELEGRLRRLATEYRQRSGTDVGDMAGSGAAGGLAGGLAALGARIVPGFDLVAGLVGLEDRIRRADLVMTGEGRLDATSLEGKVPGRVLTLVSGRAPLICVVGDAEPAVAARLAQEATVVSLCDRFGRPRAVAQTASLVEEVVASHLARLPAP